LFCRDEKGVSKESISAKRKAITEIIKINLLGEQAPEPG